LFHSYSVRFNGHFPGAPGLAGTRISNLDFIEAEDDGSGGDSWSYKSCKAPVKSSPPTNQHPVFLQADCPSCCPTNSVKALSVLIQFLGDLTGRLFATSAVYMCHVKGLCMVMEATTQADSLMLEQYVDFLQGMLFTQISQPIDYKIPASIKNHNELLRCFAVIG